MSDLLSKAYLRIVDLLCEGEIEGLVDGLGSVYFDQTPVLNADGSNNFPGVTIDTRNGTQDQSYIDGFSSVENEVSVGVQLRYGSSGAIVRTIADPNVNRVRLRFNTPAFLYTDLGSGNQSGTSVEIQVYLQPAGGSYSLVSDKVISGMATSPYEFEVEIPLTGSGPWQIKVMRQTPDTTQTNLSDIINLEAYTEVVDAKLRYPNSALVGVRIDASQFNQIPARAYDCKLLKIQIPSNYDPVNRTYTGTWDGTFAASRQWGDNPAWVFYDILTSPRFGLGAFLSADQVDKWSLYQIAKYCDELVPDGFGGMEPRFTCNTLINTRADAYTALNSLASVFRGMPYWSAGTVTVTQDSPSDPVYLFTESNVVDGTFTYQGASSKARHTVALVTWNDPNDFYQQKVEYVEDLDGIARYGVQTINVVAYGCTSRGQAHRFGKWLLYTEIHESETISFKTGLDGIPGRPGQIIQVADRSRAGVRMGGRVSAAADGSNITVDADIAGSISGNYLSVMLPDGTVESQIVVGSTGRTINVQPAFSQVPAAGAIWVLKSDVVEPQTFRVIGVSENGGGQYTITALSHNPSKFAAIEQGLLLEPQNITALKEQTDAPTGLAVTESQYISGVLVKSKATLSWNQVDRAISYIVTYTKDDNNPVQLPETSATNIDILDTSPGTYTFQVVALNTIRKRSVPSSVSISIKGLLAPPGDVVGFSMIPSSGQAYLTWDKTLDLDVQVGGKVRIRHTPLTSGQKWTNAVDVIPAVPGSATNAWAPLLSGTYMAKFVTASGVESPDVTEIVTTVPDVLALNVVDTETEDPSFSGVRTNMVMDTATGWLTLASSLLFDDYGPIDSYGSWDFPGSFYATASYDFHNTVDLGASYITNLSSYIDVEAFVSGSLIDQRVTLMDTWTDFDGLPANDVNVELYFRTTDDDPTIGSPNWSVWKLFRSGTYTARGWQFELRVTSGAPDHSLWIKHLSVTLDMPDRVLDIPSTASGTGSTYAVVYAQPFWVTPSIGITAENMQTGDYYTISGQSNAGFSIVFKNSAGTIVSRNFSAVVKGYGRKVA